MRLIDVDALLQVPNVRKVTEYDETGEFITYLAVPVEAIKNAPTIEAKPVRHGKWEEYQIPHIICCSECDYGTSVDEKTKVCPNCYAKMDLEE